MTEPTLLQLEHALAQASEMHPDHWPAWLGDVAHRLVTGSAWRDGATTGIAIALVGDSMPPARESRKSSVGAQAMYRLAEPLRRAIFQAVLVLVDEAPRCTPFDHGDAA